MLISIAFIIYNKKENMKNIVKNIPLFWNIVCGLSSILSLGLLIFGDNNAIIIALSFFCVSLLTLLIVLIRAINSYLRTGKDSDHIRIYTDIKYETNDGYKINYDTYRIIQSKCVLLQKIDHGFKWSGTKGAKISSKLQQFSGVKQVGDKDAEYDTATLLFEPPLLYNETGVVHFNAELDDSDERSDTMVSYKVSSYSELIHFRVILKHKSADYNKKAVVFRKKINNNVLCKEVEMETIPFDHKTKSFEYIKERPEVGYFYILRWERN